ncbi:M1 family metallopeptidase [Flavobacteriaceae bacterium 14752]|uniref:M1 family metallopeptidase n=1 Tax=Mesohalobacter salilacus TaxID=2491711 RepID=UPI000F62DC45|nr:M1 family peptidase [Flavobacteriaceae bacterium 14752]
MKSIIILFNLLIGLSCWSQLLSNKSNFTKKDSLRGGLRSERTAFDMLKYNLNISVDPDTKSISGYNAISFEALDNQNVMQIDLFENMKIDSIVFQNKKLKYKREFNAVFINFEKELKKGAKHQLTFYYHGKPIIAKRPPWDGGFVFDKDTNGNPWIAVAVQGTGASLWFPNKDHLSDEPDQAEINITVPKDLVAVSNGRLINVEQNGDLKTYQWQVTYPINNYNITLNIGDYIHFSDQFQDLDLDYYVLRENLDKAKKHFEQVKPMMACFYDKLGEYPFKNDSFKMVETPYLGMEHQSAVAYGNQYLNGYLGGDLSGTGYGLKFDFIIIHESAHEWFGNSISVRDIADLWIHEGFTTYAESIFVECEYGKQAALDYIHGQRQMISHNKPIIGNYGVNSEGSSDMYAKGSNIINTLRTLVDDDDLWWKTLKDFNKTFAYKTTSTEEVIKFFSRSLEKDLDEFFKQYLYHKNIPELVFKSNQSNKEIQYKWNVDVENFDMPVEIKVGKNSKWIYPEAETWKTLKIKPNQVIEIDNKKFYIDVKFK